MAGWACRVVGLAGALALGGCVSNGGSSAASNAFASADIGTVAFESVDGPPPAVFDRLVSTLDSEARLRGVAVAARTAPATYRVRSYLSAQVRGPRTTIAWVWDVYDRNEQRALRLSGEENSPRKVQDAWMAADDVVLRRIAQAGLAGLAELTGRAGLAPSFVPNRDSGAVMAENSPAAAERSLGLSGR
jgi:hypothetical protein